MPSGARIIRSVIIVGSFVLLGAVLHAGVFYPRGQCFAALNMGQEPVDLVDRLQLGNKQKVTVELFVMSKCPDGEDGEATIANVMEKVGHKVSLNFTYIARTQNTSDGMEITCMHGPSECIGNKQQLCLQKYHPHKILPFITCLNKDPDQIGNSLSYTLHCADRSGVYDYASLIQPCAESLEGSNLLIDSIDRCDTLDTHLSATFRVAGKNICIRDGGVWRDCKDVLSVGGGSVTIGLQKIIEKEWKKLNSKGLFWQMGRTW